HVPVHCQGGRGRAGAPRRRSGGLTKPDVRQQLLALYSLYDELRARVQVNHVEMVDGEVWFYTTGEVTGRLPLGMGYGAVLAARAGSRAPPGRGLAPGRLPGLIRTKSGKVRTGRGRPPEILRRGGHMKTHKVVKHDEWLRARKRHLAKEKEFTRMRDQLSRERRDLPWELVEEQYSFQGEHGTQTLSDIFEGRGQLVVYHAMFNPDTA